MSDMMNTYDKEINKILGLATKEVNLPSELKCSGYTKESYLKLAEAIKNEKPPKHNFSFFALTKDQIMAVDDGSVDELKEEIKDCPGRLLLIEDYLFQRVIHWHMRNKENICKHE